MQGTGKPERIMSRSHEFMAHFNMCENPAVQEAHSINARMQHGWKPYFAAVHIDLSAPEAESVDFAGFAIL
jgi:hypothetical protein